MKNAYLITAHGNYEQLYRLVQLIDDENNDIFIHINLKSSMPDIITLHRLLKKSKLYFCERISIEWGNCGLLFAQLQLLQKAIETNKYDYFHTLTASDLPIKSKDYIDDFLNHNMYPTVNSKMATQYVDCHIMKDGLRRSYVAQYNFFTSKWRLSNAMLRKCYKLLNKTLVLLQKACGIDRFKDEDVILCYGQPWWSITEDAARYVLSKKEWIYDHFNAHNFAADEVAIQTVIYNSKYRDTLFIDADGNYTNLMKLDFIRGNGLGSPYVWRSLDFDELKDSDKLFARKFDSTMDNEIIELITNMITEGEGFYRA